MIAKVLVTALAAGALSLPLAAVAWGEPADNGVDGVGPGGVPVKIARVLEQNGGPAVPAVPPGTGYGSNILGTSDFAKLPGSVPGALGSIGLGPLTPGDFVQAVTPGCAKSSLGCQ